MKRSIQKRLEAVERAIKQEKGEEAFVLRIVGPDSEVIEEIVLKDMKANFVKQRFAR